MLRVSIQERSLQSTCSTVPTTFLPPQSTLRTHRYSPHPSRPLDSSTPLPAPQLPEEVRLAFSRGDLNLLLATSVGAEGLDFRCGGGGGAVPLRVSTEPGLRSWVGFRLKGFRVRATFLHAVCLFPTLRSHQWDFQCPCDQGRCHSVTDLVLERAGGPIRGVHDLISAKGNMLSCLSSIFGLYQTQRSNCRPGLLRDSSPTWTLLCSFSLLRSYLPKALRAGGHTGPLQTLLAPPNDQPVPPSLLLALPRHCALVATLDLSKHVTLFMQKGGRARAPGEGGTGRVRRSAVLVDRCDGFATIG